ncbi:unnamed protein product [Lactuca virosa]|uniref:Uncharacterized protein n=1 Tax=Lactuca virosa TaxID=75947 RepID=A0AAU9NFG0_9ASTR|nr:unnamed protein product [Lactuca virosa]
MHQLNISINNNVHSIICFFKHPTFKLGPVGVAQQWYDELVELASLTQKQDGSVFIDCAVNTSPGTSECFGIFLTRSVLLC